MKKEENISRKDRKGRKEEDIVFSFAPFAFFARVQKTVLIDPRFYRPTKHW